MSKDSYASAADFPLAFAALVSVASVATVLWQEAHPLNCGVVAMLWMLVAAALVRFCRGGGCWWRCVSCAFAFSAITLLGCAR